MSNRERVSKKECYEVVWFCDSFVKNYDIAKTKENFQKVEKLIRLPQVSEILMREELNEFVAKNWHKGLV